MTEPGQLIVTVKTLDSRNHPFSVHSDITVKEFKEKIAASVGIPADKQRLIFCGRVLQDDKLLAEHDVHGKVIHLVQRPPPSSRTQSAASQSFSGSTSSPSRPAATGINRDGSSFLLGAFTIPQDMIDPTHVQHIVQEVVSGMGELGRNATVMSRTSDDGSSVDVHINLGQVPLQSEAQIRIRQGYSMLSRAARILNALDNEYGGEANARMQTENLSELDPRTNDNLNGLSDVTPPISTVTSGTQDSRSVPQSGQDEATDDQVSSNESGSISSAAARLGAGIAQAACAAAVSAVAAAVGAAAAAARAATSGSAVGISTNSVPSVGRISTPMTSSEAAAGAVGQRENSDPVNHCARDGTPNIPLASNTSNQSAYSSGTQAGRRDVIHPSVHSLANLMQLLVNVNQRLQPHLQRYEQILRADSPTSRNDVQGHQQLFNRVSQVMHYISHVYHSVSDFSVNFSAPPPRNLMVNLRSPGLPGTSVQSGVPVYLSRSVPVSSSSFRSSDGIPRGTAAAATPTATQTQPASTGVSTSTVTSSTVESGSSIPSSTISGGFPSSTFFTAQSPVVFMEVGPSTITIDSISAAVLPEVSQSTSTPSVSTTSTGSQPQHTGHYVTSTMTTTTTTAGSRTAVNTMGSLPVHSFPSAPFFPGSSAFSSFDPCLPCNSRWVFSRVPSVQRATSVVPTTLQSGSLQLQGQRQQEQQLHHVISNLMAGLLRPQFDVQGGRLSGSPNVRGPSGFSFFASSDSGMDGGSLGGGAGVPVDNSHSHHLDQSSRQRTIRQDNQTEGAAAVGRTNQGHRSNSTGFTDEMFTNLVQGIAGQMSNISPSGQPNQTTVGDFLSQLEDYSYIPGETILGDLFMCLAQVLTFQDLVSVFFGHPEPLQRVRSHLAHFVRQNILDGLPVTPTNVNLAIDRIMTQWQDTLAASAGEANVRHGISYVDTVNNFCRQHLRELINFILNDQAERSFGTILYNKCHTILSEFIILSISCFVDGHVSLERIVQNQIRQMTSEMSPLVQQWMLNMASTEIASAMSHIAITPEQVQHYIVREEVTPIASALAEAGVTLATPATCSAAMPASEHNQNISEQLKHNNTSVSKGSEYEAEKIEAARGETSPEPMEVDSCAENLYNGNINPLADETMSKEDQNPTMMVGNGKEDPHVIIGSEPWHAAIPREWVPIITRDVHRQRRQAIQSPFSDAYLNGMPSKRRKVMGGNCPHNIMAPIHSLLPEALQHAILAAGVHPLSSLDEIKQEAAQDVNLHSAYREQVRCTIHSRLHTDSDYRPEQFPNAKLYFARKTD